MKFTSISVGRTINIGNFESVRLEVTVEATHSSEDITYLLQQAKHELHVQGDKLKEEFKKK